MKITPPSIKSPVAGPVAGTRTDSGTSAYASSASGAAGRSAVDLSAAARNLSSLENSQNDVNVAKVQEIRDALASGRLVIDPSRIADGLLASVRDLLK
ncbi:flagellar biosynthesis anti-sigma factor FlgM [Parapusillimonas granuli]|uniref:Negative regulator of flagellin synthesis n=1 Tax=Parapusillimonas granuli TaxID=380911 RepID=A0A853FZJ7_9BURK|nr:flagellar biosynthesis anti-sigma factor FlgM [Parapusillimonas granuli]MBB5213401.1 negative regulator of flagellin synthesis FlgM [Parapusillimonas granuli]MEB2398501.1 flagellar biosynthesis anti-sigma factor FlgM [Alcaligenaceae bacterium]NYT48240.1 flagellar biosynthesis anti-sigma factor FlgM [Parapusillimonas granuli]